MESGIGQFPFQLYAIFVIIIADFIQIIEFFVSKKKIYGDTSIGISFLGKCSISYISLFNSSTACAKSPSKPSCSIRKEGFPLEMYR